MKLRVLDDLTAGFSMVKALTKTGKANPKAQREKVSFRQALLAGFSMVKALTKTGKANPKAQRAKFMCEKVSLRQVLKDADAMVLNTSEHDDNRHQALLVKLSIERSMNSNTTEHAAQLAFIAGMRWLQIVWAKSLKGEGAPVKDHWKKAEQIFKASKGISAGQLWIKCGRPGGPEKFDSFKRMLSRKRKNWQN
jgi:hypothetical protein